MVRQLSTNKNDTARGYKVHCQHSEQKKKLRIVAQQKKEDCFILHASSHAGIIQHKERTFPEPKREEWMGKKPFGVLCHGLLQFYPPRPTKLRHLVPARIKQDKKRLLLADTQQERFPQRFALSTNSVSKAPGETNGQGSHQGPPANFAIFHPTGIFFFF